MEILKTPKNRFDNLPGYDYSEHFIDVEPGLSMHYVDEGDSQSPIVLLLHGEPSWSYLYRKMIPVLVDHGFRAIAPDLIGFGKSDKPVEKSSYSYQKHVTWMTTFIEALKLNQVTLFCQDWGGLIGLRVITELQDRFSMVVASNTFLPTGQVAMPEVFLKWREFAQHSPGFDIGKVIDKGTVAALSEDIINAYNAPFPSEDYKSGARIFPMLVPVDYDDPEAAKNRKAWELLTQWEKPFLTIFGEKDEIMKGVDKILQQRIPGAKNQPHTTLDAGHFIQEEKGEELAEMIIKFYRDNTNN